MSCLKVRAGFYFLIIVKYLGPFLAQNRWSKLYWFELHDPSDYLSLGLLVSTMILVVIVGYSTVICIFLAYVFLK